MKIVTAINEFNSIELRSPLIIGNGEIASLTYAEQKVVVEDNSGNVGEGTGAVFLSDVWAQPGNLIEGGRMITPNKDAKEIHKILDAKMRANIQATARIYENVGFTNPLELFFETQKNVTNEGKRRGLTPLANAVTAAPIDYAVWEAVADLRGQELFTTLEEGIRYTNPNKIFHPPHEKLKISHTLGGGDKIRGLEYGNDGIPETLEAWVKEERITDIKQKLKGNVEEDLARIAEMQWLMKNKGPFTYSVDANESYTFDQLGNFLESLRERGLQFPVFIEQPVSREEINSIPKEIKTFGIPIVADESVPTVDTAIEALDRGYGLALKSTAKGLTTSTLQLVEAKKRRAYRNSQDLTNMDLALRHHLSFASRVVRANQGVEANARQYIRPRDRDAAYSKFYEVRDGHVNL